MSDSSWLEFLEKISVNNSALSDAEDNTFEPLNRGDIADLASLSEFYFRFKRFILLVQMENVICINYDSTSN